jgi:hypothetical protein
MTRLGDLFEDHADILVLVFLAIFLIGGLFGYEYLRGR